MKRFLALATCVCVTGAGFSAQATPASLAAANPFEALGQLTELTYDELAQLYPALSDADLRSLRLRIVNHMQGQE